MGRLNGIARRATKRAPMQTLDSAEVSSKTGVALDFRGKPGQRQVTVLSARAWRDACGDLETELPWTLRRANLLVDDFDLPKTIGAMLSIGDVQLEVTGELAPCSRMDEQFAGLTAALLPDWRGGVTCSVVQEGRVRLGDEVTFEPSGA